MQLSPHLHIPPKDRNLAKNYLNVTDNGHHAGAVVGELLEVVVDDAMQPNTQLGQHKLDVFTIQRFADFNELKKYFCKRHTHYILEIISAYNNYDKITIQSHELLTW